MKGWNRRFAAVFLAVMIACFSCASLIPRTAEAAGEDGIVRVYLSSISPKSSHTVKIQGNYQIQSKPDFELKKGQSYEFSLNDGTICVSYNGTTTALGKSLTLVRLQSSSSSNHLTISDRNYPGDILMSINGSGIDLICSLYMEDYLKGVIGYEMSNSWPIEALKAQAVASRTFAFSNLNPNAKYHVQDTTASQVYKGSNASWNNVIQAVDATKGQVLTFNGSLSDGYYCASNGGQTNSKALRWGGANTYHTVKDDSYDASNPNSPSSAFVFSKGKVELDGVDVTSAFGKMLGLPDNASITAIAYEGLSGLASGAPSNSREFQNLKLSVTYNGKTESKTVTTSKIKATFGVGYGNMLVSHRLWNYKDNGSGKFTITATGYGHGVGMSQRGAQYMADKGMAYRDILDFYYNGCAVTTYDYSAPVLPSGTSGGTAPTESPAAALGTGTVRLEQSNSSLNVRASASSSGTIVGKLAHNEKVEVLGKSGDWYYIRYQTSKLGYASVKYIVLSQDDSENPSSGTVTAPAVPQGLSAKSAGSNAIDVSWTAVSDATGYKVYSAPSENGEYTLIQNTTQTSFRHTGLTLGKSYWYKVSAYAKKNDLEAESEKCAPVKSIPVPAATVLNAVSSEPGTVQLSWTAVTGATSYRLQRKGSGDYETIYEGADLSYKDKASEGAKLTYRVLSIAVSGDTAFVGSACKEQSVTVISAAQDLQMQVKLNNPSSVLKVRKGPGTNYAEVGALAHGDVVTVLAVGNGWNQIKTAGGLVGYVYASYLTAYTAPAATPTPAPTATPVPTQAPEATATPEATEPSGDATAAPEATPSPETDKTAAPDPTATPAPKYMKVKLTSGSLNVRKGPGTGEQKVGSLPNGTVVEKLGVSGDWTQIRSGSLTGYVASKYLAETSDAPAPAPTATAKPSSGDATGSATVKLSNPNSYLNVREGAGTNTRVLTTVKSGTAVTVLGASNGWTQIKVGNTTGYVASRYLTSQSSGPAPTASPADDGAEKSGTVQATGLNMRKGPGSGYGIVRTLANGTKVTVTGSSGSWYKIKVGGQEGYVYKKYVKIG